eukprot:3036608-Rhodomonas_salina.1
MASCTRVRETERQRDRETDRERQRREREREAAERQRQCTERQRSRTETEANDVQLAQRERARHSGTPWDAQRLRRREGETQRHSDVDVSAIECWYALCGTAPGRGEGAGKEEGGGLLRGCVTG